MPGKHYFWSEKDHNEHNASSAGATVPARSRGANSRTTDQRHQRPSLDQLVKAKRNRTQRTAKTRAVRANKTVTEQARRNMCPKPHSQRPDSLNRKTQCVSSARIAHLKTRPSARTQEDSSTSFSFWPSSGRASQPVGQKCQQRIHVPFCAEPRWVNKNGNKSRTRRFNRHQRVEETG